MIHNNRASERISTMLIKISSTIKMVKCFFSFLSRTNNVFFRICFTYRYVLFKSVISEKGFESNKTGLETQAFANGAVKNCDIQFWRPVPYIKNIHMYPVLHFSDIISFPNITHYLCQSRNAGLYFIPVSIILYEAI